jgi:hypothetical protein
LERRAKRVELIVPEHPSPAARFQNSESPALPYPPVRDADSSLSVESTERRLLELKLMHHFTTVTATKDFLSLHDETVSGMWVETAPTLAFRFDFLLNTILSIAALHIAKIQPKRLDMADTHRKYFNVAISQHQATVRNISPANAEAVCITTILIALPAFILLQDTDVGTYRPPLQLFSLLASGIPVFSKAIPMIPQTSKLMAVVTAKPNMKLFMKELENEVYKQRFHHLLDWRAPDEVVDSESQLAYEVALSFVGCILDNIERDENPFILRRIVYSFPTLVPAIYVKRLKEKNYRALTILAYYFCLVKAVDSVWWLRGIAEREVFGIQSILPEEWQWAMAWPLQKLAEYAARVLVPAHV